MLSDIATTAKSGSALLPRIASATPREVEELATSANPSVRMLVAQRRDLPPHVRDALAEDPDAKVAKSIAPHPGLSDVQLRTMVARHGVRVLAKVAAETRTPARRSSWKTSRSTDRRSRRRSERSPGTATRQPRHCFTVSPIARPGHWPPAAA